MDTTLVVPEDTFYCETLGEVSQKGELFTTLHLKHGSGQLKLIVDVGVKFNVITTKLPNSYTSLCPKLT